MPDQILTDKPSRHVRLFADIVSIAGSLVVLIFFVNIGSGPINFGHITIKPGYSSLSWGIFSISSALYYLIRSRGQTASGGYTNRLLGFFIKIAQTLPFVGFLLSLIGAGSIIDSSSWVSTITQISVFWDSLLIFYLFANFLGGITNVWRFLVPTKIER